MEKASEPATIRGAAPASDANGDAGPRPIRGGILQFDPPRLIGSECGACGNVTFPALDFCPACRRFDGQTRRTLGTRGSVYTFTIVRQAPPGREVPYVLAYVDLPEGVRLLTQLTDVDPEDVEIGATVELVLAPVAVADDGSELVGYRFRPTPPNSNSQA